MSVSSYARAQRMHADVEAYFAELHAEAVPKALEDLQSLRNLEHEGLSDRHVNLIFKNKTLLKSAKREEKFVKKRKRSDDDDEEDAATATRVSFAHLGYVPIKFKHNDTTRADLFERAKEHQAYLRRLRGKTWSKLSTTEQCAIKEYTQTLEQFIEHLRSNEEYLKYMTSAVPLLEQIKVFTDEVREDIESAPACVPSVRYNRDAQALVAVSTSSDIICSSSSRKTLDAFVVNDESHAKLQQLMSEFTALVDYTLNLYGEIRGSGTVVQNAQVPVANVQPLTLVENADANIVSGLMCDACGVMRIIDHTEAIMSCPKCASTKPFQGSGHENFSYKEKPVIEKVKGKNYNHKGYMFKWLRKVQGKLKNDIPDELWQRLFKEFQHNRLTVVNAHIVRKTLKRFKMNAYYNAVPFITYKFNDVPLANFSDEEEVIIGERFDEYHEAFDRCPQEIKQRSSLLSYSYFLRKTVEELGWTHYVKCFPLLEGGDNLRKHDRIWKWICENKKGAKWTFIPTH